MAQRLGQALETMTRQCGQLPETPAYGSWLLGRVSESPSRRWVRIKRIVTVYIMTANLTGIVVALLVVTFAFPVPSIYTDAPWWVTFGVAPAYATLALAIGTYWITTRIVRASIRWAIEERAPSQADGRNTLLLRFSGSRPPHSVGYRRGVVGHALRAGQPRIRHHNFVLGDYLRRFGSHQLLLVHRVRAATRSR